MDDGVLSGAFRPARKQQVVLYSCLCCLGQRQKQNLLQIFLFFYLRFYIEYNHWSIIFYTGCFFIFLNWLCAKWDGFSAPTGDTAWGPYRKSCISRSCQLAICFEWICFVVARCKGHQQVLPRTPNWSGPALLNPNNLPVITSKLNPHSLLNPNFFFKMSFCVQLLM